MALLHRRSTSKRASQKMWENNAAMPDDASANDNVSSARPEPTAFVPTPFDEVIDISDLVAERRRLQRNLWAMRIITIVLLIAAIAVAFAAVITAIIAVILKATIGWRVTDQIETDGIDFGGHRETGYDIGGRAMRGTTSRN